MKIFLVVITMALFAVPALAETYTWKDDQGTVNFADDLGKVPKKYRKKRGLSEKRSLLPLRSPRGKKSPPCRSRQRGVGEKPRRGTKRALRP